jgi:hypothetical protein
VEFAGAGTVEFGEEDDLPATQSEAALLDKYRFGRADERGLDVRVGIAFCVLEEGAIGDEAIEGAFHVVGDIRVVAFIDDHASGGVRHVQMANAGFDSGIANEAFDFAVTFLSSVRRVVRTVILCTECAPEPSRLVVIYLDEFAENCCDLFEPGMQDRPRSSRL